MDFCSKYGYDYGFEGSDSDEVSDDELKNEQSSSSNNGGKKVKKLRNCRLKFADCSEIRSTSKFKPNVRRRPDSMQLMRCDNVKCEQEVD
jgi:hypothetical protein